jgi:hypothetical protein
MDKVQRKIIVSVSCVPTSEHFKISCTNSLHDNNFVISHNLFEQLFNKVKTLIGSIKVRNCGAGVQAFHNVHLLPSRLGQYALSTSKICTTVVGECAHFTFHFWMRTRAEVVILKDTQRISVGSGRHYSVVESSA